MADKPGPAGCHTAGNKQLDRLVSRLQSDNQRLGANLSRAHLGLAVIGDAVIGTDADGRIDYINAATERLSGYAESELQGNLAERVFSFRSAETNAVLANPLGRCLAGGRTVNRNGRSLLQVRGGRGVMVRESAQPVHDVNGKITGALMVLRDLSLENDLGERLSWQKRHDSLTGLLNRDELERRLAREISFLPEDSADRHSLLYLDLDRFRVINDTAGHAAGDRLLNDVACLLQEQVRGSDIAARLGGDEFAILLRDCPIDSARRVAQDICRTLEQQRLKWRNCRFRHTASIGIVGVSGAVTASEVLAAADVACFAAKESGRNKVHCFSHDSTPLGYRDMQWVSRIGDAADENRFQLYCQPIVPVGQQTKQVAHFELLLRINDRNGEVIPAAEFLPAAERFNMMPGIDRWVISNTIEKLIFRGCVTDAGQYMLSVNLSGGSLSDPSFLDFAHAEIKRAKIRPDSLCIEITETAAIANIDTVARFIRDMRQLGCRFSLDDFGSGLSSFAYLK
ncbi:MAG: diguanylate cyclase, partial [Gammaproteobacteria bacterium]|nr:diguanylate cyclase [Gammaproteobacteria bacterium]